MKLLKFKRRRQIEINDDEARRLTSLFLDGATSQDEEKRLYAYYSGRKIASDLEPYRQMFAWYEGLGNDCQQVQGNSRFPIAAAAVIAILVFAGIGLVVGRNDRGSAFGAERMYAGSYIIRDGKKISDIKKILPELQRADHLVDSTLTAVNDIEYDNYDLLVLQHALDGIQDKEVKEKLIAEIVNL